MLNADITKWSDDEKMAAALGGMVMAQRLPSALSAALKIPAGIVAQVAHGAAVGLWEGLGAEEISNRIYMALSKEEVSAWNQGVVDGLATACVEGAVTYLLRQTQGVN